MSTELSIDQEFLQKLNNLIELNLENENFGVEELAQAIGKSRSQLHRKLNAINGKSTSQFIREYRLKKAMTMLQNNVATASEIAYKVGFGSPSYFNTCFHDYYGYPPGEVKFRNPLNGEGDVEIQPLSENTDTVTIKRTLFNLRTYIMGALALILVISFTYYNYANSEKITISENDNTKSVEISIAVLPFKNMSGNPENEAFCDGMTTAIISRLSRIKGISKVISQTSMMSYKNTKKTMPEIAKELNAHYILESGFQKSENNIKINLQLIDGLNDKLLWSDEFSGKWNNGEIFKLQSEIAENIAKQMNIEISEEEKLNIKQTLTDNTEAYENYLQGVLVFSQNYSINSINASRKYFEKAIALDSTFVEAYVKLGWTYSMMGIWFGTVTKHKADSLAAPYYKKAFKLDPNNLDLITVLADKEFFNWNFKAADSMFNILRKERGDFFNCDFFNLVVGRYDQLAKSAYRSIKRNPKPGPDLQLAYVYYYKGERDSTLNVIRNKLQEEPTSEPIYDHAGNLLLALKFYERARDVLETGLQISSKRHASMVVHLSLVYHYLGDEKKSLELINEVINRAKNGEPEINVFVAHYYARLGNKDEAFKWLDIAYAKHEVDLIWLKADPNLSLLKNDVRYKKLVKKIGFLDID